MKNRLTKENLQKTIQENRLIIGVLSRKHVTAASLFPDEETIQKFRISCVAVIQLLTEETAMIEDIISDLEGED